MIDYIGRYENLHDDFARILDITGIPGTRLEKHNATKHADYKSYYNPLLVDLVEEWFARDIMRFGYKF